jgi:hypothetical protein
MGATHRQFGYIVVKWELREERKPHGRVREGCRTEKIFRQNQHLPMPKHKKIERGISACGGSAGTFSKGVELGWVSGHPAARVPV